MSGVAEQDKPTGLALLRVPFEAHQISKLPKETRAQIDERKRDRSKMVFNCPVCGGHHHKNAVHLDYVGHAALTDRLLDCDPEWNWEPLAIGENGAPKRDQSGGMWIKLTVCGVTRLGYGHADGKSGGDAIKEVIGDALRNAAMRFGAALDLWHKGQLHPDPDDDGNDAPQDPPRHKVEQRKSQAPRADVHPENDERLDFDDIVDRPDGVESLNSSQSREPYRKLVGCFDFCVAPEDLSQWAKDNAEAIYRLHPTARHHLREAYDARMDQLVSEKRAA